MSRVRFSNAFMKIYCLKDQAYTPASNLGYLAPPQDIFMGAKLFIGTTWMQNECVLKNGMGNVKKHGVRLAYKITHVSAVILDY